MIAQLKSVCYVLSYEKQVQALIRSLPNSWEYLKVNLTHNDSIKLFSDVAHHAELEDEILGADKAPSNTFVEESSDTKSSDFKRKKIWKRNRKDKETEDDPLRKRRSQIQRKGNNFHEQRQEKNEVLH